MNGSFSRWLSHEAADELLYLDEGTTYDSDMPPALAQHRVKDDVPPGRFGYFAQAIVDWPN